MMITMFIVSFLLFCSNCLKVRAFNEFVNNGNNGKFVNELAIGLVVRRLRLRHKWFRIDIVAYQFLWGSEALRAWIIDL